MSAKKGFVARLSGDLSLFSQVDIVGVLSAVRCEKHFDNVCLYP
jgi:hypothetical protein